MWIGISSKSLQKEHNAEFSKPKVKSFYLNKVHQLRFYFGRTSNIRGMLFEIKDIQQTFLNYCSQIAPGIFS